MKTILTNKLKVNEDFAFEIATDHGHIFWIQDGSIRSDINLQEFINIELIIPKVSLSNDQSIVSDNG